ncbi:AAA domain-containing protein, putative AbiEii toxin, Type IV TA system [Rheinheimera pacifica]|uniref:AAA domain-containing protein, putative AbiEii toxin, Type IV TA system n=1 Tax=Rheinheimera pacifica TaxID=173990 RepID=A0A1H6N6D4_9GAMM|nr:AAA family ATPase [Rheinheimera pacifica]SEI08043.1 AAA domain-containing protein, putative AbiEii toxin, Type IV TA system [Rheinheimera pacifica]
MPAENRSKLLRMTIRNIGCIGNDGIDIALDNIVCLVGKNNAGKSTVLRAYELAKGVMAFNVSNDRHQSATDGQPSEILLEVHIPDGIGNVDAKWKQAKDGFLIVKSRWQWSAPNFEKVRTTWDPTAGDNGEGGWAEDGKAGGADPVFSSRLPRPLRIGSLDDAGKTEDVLLNFALSPLQKELEKARLDPSSPLAIAIHSVTGSINLLSEQHQEHFNGIAGRVAEGFKGVFPGLDVTLSVGAAPLVPKVGDLIKSGSSLKIRDGHANTSLSQQGTGARRALFWSMLQVHNELNRDKEVREEFRKRLAKDLAEIEKKISKPPKGAELDVLNDELLKAKARLESHDGGAPIPDSPDDPAFPGYLLLIDEPENALHPMAARAAQRHLYQLAKNPDWQVIMTTHSPCFINPFEDHTTIVRLERSNVGAYSEITPKTYRSDHITFIGDEKQRLQALQHIDPSFSEVFFGSYPILVEGDTEHAAFMASIIERNNALMDQITIIRARGKAILVPLIKVLTHFRIHFSLIHDSDSPYRSDGSNNGMWTENRKIHRALCQARSAGLAIRHHVSVPDFERFLGQDEAQKDKPLNAYLQIKLDEGLARSVQTLMDSLLNSEEHCMFGSETDTDEYMKNLLAMVLGWATANGMAENVRFKINE